LDTTNDEREGEGSDERNEDVDVESDAECGVGVTCHHLFFGKETSWLKGTPIGS
jgi:hypothetical protein